MAEYRESWKGIATEETLAEVLSSVSGLSGGSLADGSQKTQIVDAAGHVLNVNLDGSIAVVDPVLADGSQKTKIIGGSGDIASITPANTARTTSTVVVPTQLIDPNGYTPQVRSTGELNVMMNAHSYLPATHWSPRDGIFTYTSSSTLTASGFPFTVDNNCQIRSIGITRANSTMVLYENGTNGISLSAAANVLTILKDGVAFTTFLNTDLKYAVAINYAFQSVDSTLDVTKTIEQSPNRNAYVADSLVDTTNVAAATVYYPSALGMSMDGYKDLSLSWKIIEGDAVTDTLELQFTNDEDTTNADWITGYVYDVKNNAMVNQFTTANTAGTYTGLWDAENCNFSYFRVKTVVADSTNTWIIKIRRKA